MKYFNICLLFIICALCYGLVAAQDEGAPAANVSPAKRIAALRRPVGKAAKVTTSTTVAPAHDDAAEEDEYNEEAGAGGEHGQYGDEHEDTAAASTTTTSTEPPKKVGPVIRPFRSNDDFLNSLKRRQQNAKKHRSEKVPASKPAKKSDDHEPAEHEDSGAAAAPAPAPAAPNKGYKSNSALNRRKLSKPVKAEPAEVDAAAEGSEQQPKEEEPKPKRPLGGSRLGLRKRN